VRAEMTPTIQSVESCLVRMPLARPAAFATRTVLAREYVLVRLTTEEGISGLGFTYAGSNAGSVVSEAVATLLAPTLVGRPRHLIEGLWELMYRGALLHGRAGSVMRALSALDIALWDLNAKAASMPLWQYLGAYRDERVPCYASGGYYKEGTSNGELPAEMKGYVDRGFRVVKMKIGRADAGVEELRVRGVREAIGPDVMLLLDANNAWTDLFSAVQTVKRLEPFFPAWIEEPFSPDDIDNHARLSSATTIPIATGEIEAGRWRFRSLLEARAAQVLQPDALVCGGITEWRRIAALASAYGVPVCPHAWHDIHVHLVAATPNAPFVEYFVDEDIVCTQPLLTRRMKVEDGHLLLPKDIGLGFDFLENCVDQHAVSRWHTVSH
jgi:L-alanine-DL-glutamate epimerase-like enolase superfamily enzyme